jgi:NAD(P)-dependent dehydrogenase (short-subunit alcohol dehydrogenase family)
LITGGTRGIGLGIAHGVLSSGGAGLPAAKACLRELARDGLQTSSRQADVRDSQAIDRVAEQVVARMIPLQRFGTPEEIGHAVAILSSNVWSSSVRVLIFTVV